MPSSDAVKMPSSKSHSFHSDFTKISPQRAIGLCYTSGGKREALFISGYALEKNSASRRAGNLDRR